MNKKEEIIKLRRNGLGYKRIAMILDISPNTVKSICQRGEIDKGLTAATNVCPVCGEILIQTKGKRVKKYCSDACRMKWWNSHIDKVNRQSYTSHQCLNCQKMFQSYANSERKYCCHSCYIASRFGGNHD